MSEDKSIERVVVGWLAQKKKKQSQWEILELAAGWLAGCYDVRRTKEHAVDSIACMVASERSGRVADQ